MANHRVGIVDARNDDRVYAGHGGRLIGPFWKRDKAAVAIDRATAAVAIRYAGMDITVEQALDETFGTEDADERQRRSDQYYLTALNLLDGAEATILEQMIQDDEELQECSHWVCHICDDEWTGPDRECHNCRWNEELAAEAQRLDEASEEEATA